MSLSFQLRALVFYTDPKTKNIAGILLYNILGMGEEWARKLIREAKPFPLHQELVKDYAKLFELWETEENEKFDQQQKDGASAEQLRLTEEEVEAYQERED